MTEQITDEARPFSMAFVLRTTAKHMRKSIDISIRKTFGRVEEFDGDQKKSEEIFRTLSFLHKWRENLDEFQASNSNDFKGEQNDR